MHGPYGLGGQRFAAGRLRKKRIRNDGSGGFREGQQRVALHRCTLCL